MPEFEFYDPEGQKRTVTADSRDMAQKAFDYAFPNMPPAGNIVVGSDRAYVTPEPGRPSSLSVELKGKGQQEIQDAVAALELRRRNAITSGPLDASLLQGMTLGYGDEAASGAFGAAQALRGMFRPGPDQPPIEGQLPKRSSFGEGYNVAQEAQRQQLAQERKDMPVLSAGVQAGGSLLPATAMPVSRALQAAPMAYRMLGGGLTGGALGTAAGFGEGSGLDDRLSKAGTGGLVGGALGTAAPPVGAGLGNLATMVADYFNPAVRQGLTALGLGRPAAQLVTRSMGQDDALMPGGLGRTRITEAGPNASLADSGPSGVGLLDAVTQAGGPGTAIGTRFAAERGQAANRDLTAGLDATLGAPVPLAQMTQGIRTGSAAARGTAYDTAYAQPIDYTAPNARGLQDALGEVPEAAYGAANRLLTADRARALLAGEPVPPLAPAVRGQPLNVQQIDYLTRGLRQEAEAGADAGALGGRTDISRALQGLAGDLRGRLSALVPEYRTALQTAADPISRAQALEVGSNLMKPSMGRDEVAQELAHRTTGPELQAIRTGVRAHIDDLMANVRDAMSNPNLDAREAARALGEINSRAGREKLQMIMDPLQYQSLQTQLLQATRGLNLAANMATNSKTAARQAFQQTAAEVQEPGILGSAMEGRPLQMTQRITQGMFGRSPADRTAMSDEMQRQVAQILADQRGGNALTTLDRLVQLQGGMQSSEAAGRLVRDYFSRLVPPAGVAGFESERYR